MAAPLYDRMETVRPGIRRLLARNPGPFTYKGTGTYVVGEGDVAVIDPGPDDPEHIATLIEALAGERITHILATHTHRDHSPGARPLKAATGAMITGCAPLLLGEDDPAVEAPFDRSYAPDHVLKDGEGITGPGWTLTAVATPGHTSNHLCFAYPEASALFTGDHVMGWSTTVIAPPDGNMTAYMDSLEKLRLRDDAIYFPTHGDPVTDPQRWVRGLIGHRRVREASILKLLRKGVRAVPEMVLTMYAGVDPRLHPAARCSVLAHLIDLRGRGLVAGDGEHWRIAA